MAKKPRREWDEFDEQAAREGNARSKARELGAVPTILGKKLQTHHGQAKTVTSHFLRTEDEHQNGNNTPLRF